MTYPPQQSDGNWPEQQQWPNQAPYDPNQPASGAPASPAYPASPGYGYQPQPAGYPQYGYGTPAVMVPARATNGLAIASLVCALAGLATCGVTAIVGAILGHVARKQIRTNGQDGDGLALGGIIAGWIIFGLYLIGFAIYIVAIVFVVSHAANNPGVFDPTYVPTPEPT
jgi:hypothetical protein